MFLKGSYYCTNSYMALKFYYIFVLKPIWYLDALKLRVDNDRTNVWNTHHWGVSDMICNIHCPLLLKNLNFVNQLIKNDVGDVSYILTSLLLLS